MENGEGKSLSWTLCSSTNCIQAYSGRTWGLCVCAYVYVSARVGGEGGVCKQKQTNEKPPNLEVVICRLKPEKVSRNTADKANCLKISSLICSWYSNWRKWLSPNLLNKKLKATMLLILFFLVRFYSDKTIQYLVQHLRISVQVKSLWFSINSGCKWFHIS